MKEVDGVVILEAITTTMSHINTYNDELFDNFFIREQEDDINLEIGIATANNAGKNKVYLPMQDSTKGLSTNDPGHSFNMEGATFSIEGRTTELNEILEGIIIENENKVASRAAKVFKDQLNLTKSEDYILCIKENPMHSNIYNSLMTTFPTAFYQDGVDPETNKPIYKRDDEKYEQLMEKYGFMDLLEKNQKFMMEETLPYVQAKKNGNITPKQAREYKEKYVAHLQNMKELSQKIVGLDFNDPLVVGNRAVVGNSNIEMRWHGEFTNVVNKISTFQNSMGNGWATRDYGILTEIMNWHNQLNDTVKNREATKEEKATAKKILAEVKDSYDALFTSKIDSLDIRNKLLGDIKQVAYKYEGETPLTVMIDDDLAANVQKAEMGIITTQKNIEYNDFVVVNDANSINDTSVSIDENLSELKEAPSRRTSQDKVREEKAVGLKAFDTSAMKKQVDNLYKAMKDVDYFMFGKSSDEFNNMMSSVTKMKEQMDSMAKEGKTPKLEELVAFGDMVVLSKDKVKLYLEKKSADFEKDGNRRDSEKKQSREQNRIQNALESFDKLNDIEDITRGTIEDEFLPKYKAEIKSQLEKEEKLREKEDISVKNYMGSVTRSFYLIGFEKGKASSLEKKDTETFTKYTERIQKFKVPKLNDEQTAQQYKDSQVLRDLVKGVVGPDKKLPKDENGKTIPYSTAELRYNYNEAIKKTAAQKIKTNGISTYKNTLVSRQRKEKMVAQNKGPKM